MSRRLAAAALLACLCAFTQAAPAQGFGISDFEATIHGQGETIDLEAGSHPVAVTASVGFDLEGGGPLTEGDVKDLSLELPPGLLENSNTVQRCSQTDFLTPRSNPFDDESRSGESCPAGAQVGLLTLDSSFGGGQTRTFGLFNLNPPPGAPTELGANPYGAPITFVPSVRQSGGEYGTTLRARGISQALNLSRLKLTLWGVPWNPLHDSQRGNCLNEAEPQFGWSKCSLGAPLVTKPLAYLTLPTSCDGPLDFSAVATSWQAPAAEATSTTQTPQQSGCESLPFEPQIAAQLSDPRASSPSGYTFDINVDVAGVVEPSAHAPTPIRKAVIALPEELTINPSVGSGLGVCTPAAFAAETTASNPGEGCPNESKIGDFRVRSPILTQAIKGAIYLAAPGDNPFGSLLGVYLVAKSTERGILVKVAGDLQPDPVTGRLTATFDRLPQLPYSQLEIHFREGQRSPLATPPACGVFQTSADLTPWRDSSVVRHLALPLQINAGAGGGPCPQGIAPFAPTAKGGSLNSQAGAYSPFYLRLARGDTEQEIVSYSAAFPPGLLGKLAGIPYCPDAAIAAAAQRSGTAEREQPSCPAASKIGHTVAGYGVGTVPTYAPGGLYLAGPYRGSQISVVAIDSALVGPFDLGTVIVRAAIRVDPITAQAEIDAEGTDPIPHIVQGIPIHLRDVRIYIDRPEFMVNPTSCEPFQISSALNGAGALFGNASDDSLATATAPYQAFNCSALGFRPALSLRLKGGTRRGRHPSLRAVLRPRRGDANIGSASVALPHSLFLDQSHIRTICTRKQFAARNCPADSVYGSARAYTPLLADPLEGPVYLRSSDNTLPDLVFALRREGIEIDVAGKIDSYKGGIRATFPIVPDGPVTRFEVKIAGGKRGILQASDNLCRGQQLATARFMGHANRGWAFHPPLKPSCGKSKKKGRR